MLEPAIALRRDTVLVVDDTPETLHLLTVHHKDGNHEYNPPDGSNWENLCAYCHEAEHTKGLLGDYLTGRDTPPGRS